MIVYSKKIINFIQELNQMARSILANEVHLKVNKNRFFDFRHEFSYPICIVVYNNKNMLGYFDSHFYEIGFHECLIQANKEELLNIIRHEIAHYLVYIEHGDNFQAHGAAFRSMCCRFGWGRGVYEATIQLTSTQESAEHEKSSIFRKVQKLMALATSSNANEAEQAMLKSQQLLLKHNIDIEYASGIQEERIFLKRLMKQKKEDAKMRSIARIIETFFVSVILKRSNGFVYLEILGNSINVEIAEYVIDVLKNEMDSLWDQAKKQTTLSGKIAKNSFFLGIAKGYLDKIHALKQAYQAETTHALMVIERKLAEAQTMIYRRLSKSKSNANFCPQSSALGEKIGQQLTIHPAIHKPSNNSPLFIHFSK